MLQQKGRQATKTTSRALKALDEYYKVFNEVISPVPRDIGKDTVVAKIQLT
jgi:hypothetical protein